MMKLSLKQIETLGCWGERFKMPVKTVAKWLALIWEPVQGFQLGRLLSESLPLWMQIWFLQPTYIHSAKGSEAGLTASKLGIGIQVRVTQMTVSLLNSLTEDYAAHILCIFATEVNRSLDIIKESGKSGWCRTVALRQKIRWDLIGWQNKQKRQEGIFLLQFLMLLILSTPLHFPPGPASYFPF